jgi:hypothetical protein
MEVLLFILFEEKPLEIILETFMVKVFPFQLQIVMSYSTELISSVTIGLELSAIHSYQMLLEEMTSQLVAASAV